MIDTNDCWLWAGQISSTGYGVYYLKIDGKWRHRFAHRLLYENMVGEIPKGLVLDHLCRVRRCVNPQHLEAVTDAVNIARGAGEAPRNKAKTHCPHGHSFANAYITPQGHRKCKQCRLEQRRRIRYRKRNLMGGPYRPETLGSIRIYIDNRIKRGSLFPTKDGKDYRCSKKTLADLRAAIAKENGNTYLQDRIVASVLYQPFVVPSNITGLVI